jgi:NAD(P)-dependent dehydrogenase (short-subunit alcohol dehydrogenase family)
MPDLRGRADRHARQWVAAWERTLRVNLIASAELCRSPCSIFRNAGTAAGSSTSPAAPPIAAIRPDHWHYAASKAGMVGMTKSIARGYAGRGHPRFRGLPGFHQHGMVDDYLASRGGARLLADIPLGRSRRPTRSPRRALAGDRRAGSATAR